ncbi:hypothetical protein A2U01_0115988, partial [Trifolium medium]|nr:hypothetical protein [Trifolium medium]
FIVTIFNGLINWVCCDAAENVEDEAQGCAAQNVEDEGRAAQIVEEAQALLLAAAEKVEAQGRQEIQM